ncbi:MAG TPA: RES domain-containing protein [Salinimicrobium sp.]|nr:RES domain-containing protein [Salinimicrobium sp.]
MIVYRIAKKKRIKDLSGTGPKLAGGRWNPKGYAVLYCASNSSLAILEKLTQVDFDLVPNDLYIAEIEIPKNSIEKIKPREMPKDWNMNPSPDNLKIIGRNWITENKNLVFQVPSAVNPNETNFLINVAHQDFHKIQIKKIYPFTFDDRLVKN